jgi:hypothetical protein
LENGESSIRSTDGAFVSQQDDTKRENGQFFTTTNPFNHLAFHRWIGLMNEEERTSKWLEPFAGANNILEMLSSVGVKRSDEENWQCYDIEPVNDEENSSGVRVEERDMFVDYPSNFPVAVTNPPYLAKNSATRRGLAFPDTKYDDVYKHAVDLMLGNHDWVAAIIPESFITCRDSELKTRLWAVVSLNCSMFEDTEVPVCLALFINKAHDDPRIWDADGRCLGAYADFQKHNDFEGVDLNLRFNDPSGSLGLYACDDTKTASIHFCDGENIESERVKQTSRAVTRISGAGHLDTDELVRLCNQKLNEWRTATEDIFLTSFKGLRDDGQYRRRLDWANAARIISWAGARVEGAE